MPGTDSISASMRLTMLGYADCLGRGGGDSEREDGETATCAKHS